MTKPNLATKHFSPLGIFTKFGEKAKRVRHLVRLTAFDESTEDGRAQERMRKVFLSAAASALTKVITVSTALISVPLTLSYLGPERYGLWMTISSVIAMLSFADFGIGNGVLSLVARAKGLDSVSELQRIVSSASLMLILIALVGGLIYAIVYPLVDWPALFNAKSALASQEVGPALTVFVAIFLLNIPAGLVGRVQAGLQESFKTSLWLCAGSLLALASVVIAANLELALPLLVLAMAGPPMMCSLMNTAHFFIWDRPQLHPRFSYLDVKIMREVARTGLLFLVLQAAASITYASDNILIVRLLGPETVTNYAIPEKLFSLIPMTALMALQPLWPAYGEALSRGDHAWAVRVLKQSIYVGLTFASVIAIPMVLFGPAVIHAWAGPQVQVSTGLLLALAFWKIVEVTGIATAAFLNGAQVVTLQVAIASLTAITALGAKFWSLQQFGITALPLAMALTYLAFTLTPYYILRRAVLKN